MSKHEEHEEEFGAGCCGGEHEEQRGHSPWGHAWRHWERHMPPHHFWGRGHDCGCGSMAWGSGFAFRRRFPTREERIAWLEQYLKDLQAEAKAVEERIAELRAAQ